MQTVYFPANGSTERKSGFFCKPRKIHQNDICISKYAFRMSCMRTVLWIHFMQKQQKSSESAKKNKKGTKRIILSSIGVITFQCNAHSYVYSGNNRIEMSLPCFCNLICCLLLSARVAYRQIGWMRIHGQKLSVPVCNYDLDDLGLEDAINNKFAQNMLGLYIQRQHAWNQHQLNAAISKWEK